MDRKQKTQTMLLHVFFAVPFLFHCLLHNRFAFFYLLCRILQNVLYFVVHRFWYHTCWWAVTGVMGGLVDRARVFSGRPLVTSNPGARIIPFWALCYWRLSNGTPLLPQLTLIHVWHRPVLYSFLAARYGSLFIQKGLLLHGSVGVLMLYRFGNTCLRRLNKYITGAQAAIYFHTREFYCLAQAQLKYLSQICKTISS